MSDYYRIISRGDAVIAERAEATWMFFPFPEMLNF
jgi:hypothetical protein